MLSLLVFALLASLAIIAGTLLHDEPTESAQTASASFSGSELNR
ncbi:hypothetical protein [Hymenobacter aquaticus]|nr:hypothetical protein [Hymenobacter aquaticus]